jgi:hypothetical protein
MGRAVVLDAGVSAERVIVLTQLDGVDETVGIQERRTG